MALHRAGDRAVIGWRRLYPKPAGSLPGGIVTQWGVGIITILVLVFLTYWIYFGGGEEAGTFDRDLATEQTAPRSFADQMAEQVEAESLRAETRRQAAERALQQQGRQQRQQGASGGGIGAGRVNADQAKAPGRDKSRHRAALHRGRMGTPGALAAGSGRAAQPVASQFAGRTDLPATGRQGGGVVRGAGGRNRKPGRCHESGRGGGARTGPRHDWDGHDRPPR